MMNFVQSAVAYIAQPWIWFRDWWNPSSNGSALLPAVEDLPSLDIQDVPSVTPDAAPSKSALISTEQSSVTTLAQLNRYHEAGSSRWHFRATILDRLDEYFVCMQRMKRHDPANYDLFSKLGFSVPADVVSNWKHPDNQRLTERRSFGGCMMSQSKDDDRDRIVPSFYYFVKVSHPGRVQTFQGEIYALTCLYDDRDPSRHWYGKLTVPMTCHVAVTTDGRTELLKEATISNRRIETGRRNRKHKREIIRLNTIQWIYPRWILEVSTLDGANEWAGGLLRFAMMTNASTLEKIIVRVTKAGCTAAFGIDLARGKYFFSDRDDSILAADGKKKRIFHAVRSHLRQLPTGEITVRDHYRGLRHFDWNGYAINIVLPHLNRIMEFDKPSIYTEDLSKEEIVSYVDQQVVGEKFAEVLSS